MTGAPVSMAMPAAAWLAAWRRKRAPGTVRICQTARLVSADSYQIV